MYQAIEMNLDRVQDGKIYLHGPCCCRDYGLGRRYHSIRDVCKSDIDNTRCQVDWGDRRSEDVIYNAINTDKDIPIPCLEQAKVKRC
jgi:hypothetical protein